MFGEKVEIMFLDKVKIVCKAGNGGDGCISFRREKYVPNGGPDGGDGGKGGNIIFKSTAEMTNLTEFRYKKVFRAENGEGGSGNNRYGKSAKDLTILVPVGTVVKDAETGKVLADFIEKDEEFVILKGGAGGRGNAKFATATKQAPRFSELGIKTKEFELILELKTIADVGLLGFPNVGKSSLLASVSNAKPKIANYHFTTLSPNIGVVKFFNSSFVLADIPGLISGASEGLGLGHDFLKHIERTRLLIHVVDISGSEGRDALEDYEKINSELKNYGNNLDKIPQIIALNKCDLCENREKIEEFKKKVKNVPIYEISAVAHLGLNELLEGVVKKLETLPKTERLEIEATEIDRVDNKHYEIIRDGKYFIVRGGLIDEILRGVVLSDFRSNAYFQKRIKEEGIIDALKVKGLKEGDLVKLGNDIELEYVD